jgi:cytochrome c551/c552
MVGGGRPWCNLTQPSGKERQMKQTIGFTLTVLALVVLLATLYSNAGSAATAPDGKAIFLEQKCNMCHAVSTAGIEATTKSAAMKGPDLVNVKTDAAAMTKFLHKETEMNGKKHPKDVKLSDADTKTLIDWILAQKK